MKDDSLIDIATRIKERGEQMEKTEDPLWNVWFRVKDSLGEYHKLRTVSAKDEYEALDTAKKEIAFYCKNVTILNSIMVKRLNDGTT